MIFRSSFWNSIGGLRSQMFYQLSSAICSPLNYMTYKLNWIWKIIINGAQLSFSYHNIVFAFKLFDSMCCCVWITIALIKGIILDDISSKDDLYVGMKTRKTVSNKSFAEEKYVPVRLNWNSILTITIRK